MNIRWAGVQTRILHAALYRDRRIISGDAKHSRNNEDFRTAR
jgi:hypothetical protein